MITSFFDSTNADLKAYMKQFMMSRAKESDIDLLLEYYPDDQRAGSPFDTGYDNVFSMFPRYESASPKLRLITRSTIQAYCCSSRRFRFPRPASSANA